MANFSTIGKLIQHHLVNIFHINHMVEFEEQLHIYMCAIGKFQIAL